MVQNIDWDNSDTAVMPRPPWMVGITVAHGPRYLAIAQGVKNALISGALKPGDRLPPQRDFAQMLGLNLGTVTRAFDELHKMGLIKGEVGRGTYLARPDIADAPASLWDHSQPHGFIDLSHNFPEHAPGMAGAALLTSGFDAQEIQHLLARQVDAGYLQHRVAAAAWLEGRGVQTKPDNVIVTCGAQHGLLLALGTLTRPGDMVLTEELTYYGLKSAATMMGRPIVGVRMDHEGLLPDALDIALQRSRAKVLFCCPTLHNPTTATMSRTRRQEIVDVCRQHNVVIVEDDVYGWMTEEQLPTLASLAPERTIYVTGLSKLIGPGLRIGYVAAPTAYIRPLGIALRATTLMASPLNSAAALKALTPENMARIVTDIRRETYERHAIIAACLPPAAVISRPGAFYFGLRVGRQWTAQTFTRAAEAAGIGVTPYDVFESTPMMGNDVVRVCHNAAPDQATLKRALSGLALLLRAGDRVG